MKYSGNETKGDYSLQEVINFTYQHFKTRFDYKDRDVLKRIYIYKTVELSPDREGSPIVHYEINSRSYPQYSPYNKEHSGAKQRKYYHDYDTFLTMDELSLSTKNWKMRVGSGKKVKDAPKSKIKTIDKATKITWKKEQAKLLKNARTPAQKEKAKNYYSDKVKKHIASAPYLNQGDWAANVLGVNLDWIYRDAFAFFIHGHFFGKSEYALTRPSKLNPNAIPFLTKHSLRVLEKMLESGILDY